MIVLVVSSTLFSGSAILLSFSGSPVLDSSSNDLILLLNSTSLEIFDADETAADRTDEEDDAAAAAPLTSVDLLIFLS